MDRNTIKYILRNKKTLEIGPYLTPFLTGDNVKYADIRSLPELLSRAKTEKYPFDETKIPRHIDFIVNQTDLSSINEKFEAVFSSHCIEHQIDLIKHLQQVSDLLEDGSSYFLCIPDKRYCFDHFKNASLICDIIAANGQERPSLQKVLLERLFSTHNNQYDHWNGNFGDKILALNSISDIIKKYESDIRNNINIDIHNWHFTPKSFYYNMIILHKLKYINLFPIIVTDTANLSNEFYAQLIKDKDFKIKKDISVKLSDIASH